MAELSDKGYLEKTHTSAGRTPTTLGLRFFINELMEEQPMNNQDMVDIKMSLFKKRFEINNLLDEVLSFLASETGYVSIGLVDDVFRYHGISSLTDFEELRNMDIFESILNILENESLVKKIFEKGQSEDVCILIGDECEVGGLGYCAFVFTDFVYVDEKQGYVGLLGPKRMRYTRVLPMMRFVKNVLEDSVKGW
jgi:heat-inducible transcriptional repressor